MQRRWRSILPPPGSARPAPDSRTAGFSARRSRRCVRSLPLLRRHLDRPVIAARRVVRAAHGRIAVVGDATVRPIDAAIAVIAGHVGIGTRLSVGRDRVGVAGERRLIERALRHDVDRLLVGVAARIAAAPAHRRAAIVRVEARQRGAGRAAAPIRHGGRRPAATIAEAVAAVAEAIATIVTAVAEAAGGGGREAAQGQNRGCGEETDYSSEHGTLLTHWPPRRRKHARWGTTSPIVPPSPPPGGWNGSNSKASMGVSARRRSVVSHSSYACSMIFSENRYPLFGIML